MAPNAADGLVDYNESINFHELVQIDSAFKQLLVQNHGRMDWKNPQHVMQLTKCLLQRDFRLSMELPNDRLCPPVPGRYSYIRWLASLVDTTSGTYLDTYDPERQVTGIDIGTGASCIYPLLGTACRPNWRFYATELDDKSHGYAVENVHRNDLGQRIKVLKISPLEGILPLDRHGIERADFTMCNPPFFSSRSEMMSTHDKAEVPSAVCTGAEIEMITEGGDSGFVSRMISESKELGTCVQWYTSMLGKLSSLSIVVEKLKELDCTNWAVGCLLTGGKTRRWVVGWSWNDLRPSNIVARCDIQQRDALPFPTELTIQVAGQAEGDVIRRLDNIFAGLDVKWQWRTDLHAGVVLAVANVWSRAARRRKRQSMIASDEMDVDGQSSQQHADWTKTSPESNALAVKLSTHEERVNVRWLRGRDSILFESFCGMIKRELNK